MKGKTCFFIGHRDAPASIWPNLKDAIEMCIVQHGVMQFYVGQYGSFDHMAASAVIDAKQHYKQVKLFLVLPYHPAIRPIKAPSGYDGTYYPDGMEQVPPRFAIVRVNRYTVDHSDYLIAYVWHSASNARGLLEYANKREQRRLMEIILVE